MVWSVIALAVWCDWEMQNVNYVICITIHIFQPGYCFLLLWDPHIALGCLMWLEGTKCELCHFVTPSHVSARLQSLLLFPKILYLLSAYKTIPNNSIFSLWQVLLVAGLCMSAVREGWMLNCYECACWWDKKNVFVTMLVCR
jgi:hypothetical protein